MRRPSVCFAGRVNPVVVKHLEKTPGRHFSVLSLALIGGLLFAQAATAGLITDFAIFGNTSVDVGTNPGSSTVPIGPIGSNGSVTIGNNGYLSALSGGGKLSVGDNAVINGNATFNGDTNLGKNISMTGNVNAGGNFGLSNGSTVTGNVKTTGTTGFGNNAKVTGNVDGGGNGSFGSNTGVTGNLTLGGIVSSGSPIVGGVKTTNGSPAAPSPYTATTVPGALSYTAGGANLSKGNNQSSTLFSASSPFGVYGSLDLGNNNVLALSTPGDYYFDAWDIGNGFSLKLDLDAGQFRIFIVGDVDVGNNLDIYDLSSNTQLDPTNAVDALLAKNLFFEVGGSFTAGNNADWLGTLFAPNGNITFGNDADIAGALYSGGKVNIGTNLDMTFKLADNTPFVDPPSDPVLSQSVPEPTTLALFGLGIAGLSLIRRRSASQT